MKKVWLFSGLLVAGLVGSQFLSESGTAATFREIVRMLTMFALSFIMIHVGYEFEIDRSRIGTYALDYGVAATAAGFPWIFCALYFVFLLHPGSWHDADAWKESLLAGRFAAPTSAGILFSMLAAAGLSATWYFRKVRILAIFDDLDTVLFMIPLKMLLVGFRTRAAALLVAAMMTMFTVAIAIALHRGLEMSCGCFASQGAAEDPISGLTMLRDLGWLVLALYVLFLDRNPMGIDRLLGRQPRPLPGTTEVTK